MVALNELEPLGMRSVMRHSYLGWEPTDMSFPITRFVTVRITSESQPGNNEDMMFPTVASNPWLEGMSLERTAAAASTCCLDNSSGTQSG